VCVAYSLQQFMHQDVVAQMCGEGAAASSRNRTCVSGEPIPETRHKSALRKRGSGKLLNRKLGVYCKKKDDYGESKPEIRLISALRKCGSDETIGQNYVTYIYYEYVFAMYLY
jgi:hypothetical protein